MTGYDQAYVPIMICSVISGIACLFMCGTILRYEELRNKTSMRYVFFLELSYLIQAIVTIWYIPDDISAYCSTQATMIRMCGMAGLLWTGFIGFSIYWEDVLKQNSSKLGIKYPIIVILLIACLAGILPDIYPTEGFYQRDSVWCWVKTAPKDINNGYVFGLYYAIIWFVMISQLFMFIHIFAIRKHLGASNEKLVNLKYYPLVLICCFTPQSISRIIQSSGINEGYFGFKVFSACALRMLGFCNFIVYGLTRDVRDILFSNYSNSRI